MRLSTYKEAGEVNASTNTPGSHVPYEAPAVEVLGSVADITLKAGAVNDGNPNKNSAS
jgi:hypothetical protein